MQLTTSVELPESTTVVVYRLENTVKPASLTLQNYITQLNCNPIMYTLSVVSAVNSSTTSEQNIHFMFPNAIELLFVELENVTFFSVFTQPDSETTMTKMVDRPFDTELVYNWCDYFFTAAVQAMYISGYIK